MRHRNPLEAIARARDEAMADRAKQACEPTILPVCAHGTTGGEQFCIFCLRRLADDARAAIEAARAMVDPSTSLIMCHHEREADFEDGNGCDCLACMTAQALVDALAKVSE